MLDFQPFQRRLLVGAAGNRVVRAVRDPEIAAARSYPLRAFPDLRGAYNGCISGNAGYEITLPAQSSSKNSRQGMISTGPIFLRALSLETTMTRDGR